MYSYRSSQLFCNTSKTTGPFRRVRPCVSTHLEVATADEKRGVDGSLDVLEDVVERVGDDASQLGRITIALHRVRLAASSLLWLKKNKREAGWGHVRRRG